MYDELIKNLRGIAKGFCPFDIGNKMCGYFVTQEAADAIEELQKQLQKSEEDNVNLTGWLAEEHARAEEAKGKNMKYMLAVANQPRWISITERLPEGGDESGQLCENVILLLSVKYNKNYVTAGWINGVTKKVYYLDEKDDYIHKTDMSVVKAWMSLPQPPEREGK